MNRTLVFGSLNIDYTYEVPHIAAPGETVASGGLQRFAGGKGLNQSIALARAGMRVQHAGAVGPDGAFLLEELQAAGVDASLVRMLPDAQTGHAIIQRTPDGANCILLHGGANLRVEAAQAGETLAGFGEDDLLVLQNEISALPEIVRLGRERGMQIALNPSPVAGELAGLLPMVDVLILNEVEAAQFLGAAADADPAYLLRKLRTAWPQTAVVLTLGGKGALYADAEQTIQQPAVSVQTVDTTAAGDTFTGYFLAGRMQGRDPAWCMACAAAAAGLAVACPGAASSIPHKEAVLALMDSTARKAGTPDV